MGKSMPPYYGEEDIKTLLQNISKDDEQINDLIVKLNELFIKRAEDVKAYNKAVSKVDAD